MSTTTTSIFCPRCGCNLRNPLAQLHNLNLQVAANSEAKKPVTPPRYPGHL